MTSTPPRTPARLVRPPLPSPELRARVRELYDLHAELLDEGRLAEWVELFTPDCLYRVVSRENAAADLPLALMRCEGEAGLRDRVHAIQAVSVYTPRVMRHLVSGLRIAPPGPDGVPVRASFAVFESLPEEPTRLFATGTYEDVLREADGELRFAHKTAVYDGALIPNAMVYPL